MVWNKRCKHCNNGKGAVIRENSRVKAKIAGGEKTWKRLIAYFKTHGNIYNIIPEDYICQTFGASVWTHWRELESKKKEVETTTAANATSDSPHRLTDNLENGVEFDLNSGQDISVEATDPFESYRNPPSQISSSEASSSQWSSMSQLYQASQVSSTSQSQPMPSSSSHVMSQSQRMSSSSQQVLLQSQPMSSSSQSSSMSSSSQQLLSQSSNTASQSTGTSVVAQAVYSQSTSSDSFRVPQTPKKIKLEGISTLKYTHSKCMVCSRGPPEGTKSVPESARRDLWLTENIYLPKGSRACRCHVSEEIFNPDARAIIRTRQVRGVNVTPKETEDWLKWLTEKLKIKTQTLNFDGKLDGDSYKDILGVSEPQFNKIFSYIKSHLLESRNRTPRNALALFLAKLRLGISQSVLGKLFGIPQQSTVSDTIHRITDLLSQHFVPRYMGVNHIEKEKIKCDHNPSYVRQLFNVVDPSSLVYVVDGTYVYIQKSADFEIQSGTFSPHKYRHLLKFMMITTPDGYIVDAIGPYFADSKNNDASILSHILDEDPRLPENFAVKGNFLLLDRGFRNVTTQLDERGIKWAMPSFLPKTRKAFTEAEANESRRVTLCRWSVEAVNGRIKNKFDLFDNILPNTYIPILDKLFRIACAILNSTFSPVFIEGPRHQRILDQVETRAQLCNAVKGLVDQFDLTRRVFWKRADATNFRDFPKLSLEDLTEITLGVYQLRMGSLYNIRHLLKDTLYEMWVHKEENGMLRVKLQSRFRRAMTHTLWIMYKTNIGNDAAKSALGFYCLCQQGARTFGTCSHITAVLLYLGYERYHPQKPKKQFEILDAAQRIVREENEEAVNDNMEIMEDVDENAVQE